ncbi:MAG: fibronectin type III domain-containing protein [Gammaproteobacteria bacterium]
MSVDSVYQEGSFGKIAFPPYEAGGGRAIGPLSINGPTDASGNLTCDYYTIASRADAAAAASPFNEVLSQYQRKIYLIPPGSVSSCNWLALGQIGFYGNSGTRLSWSTRNDANALIHELGHNEGWHHAGLDADNNEVLDGGTGGEYGDTSDAMGYCCSKRKFNAVHLDQIGWLPTDKIVNVMSSGTYNLEPVGSLAGSCVAPDGFSPCPQLVKIQKENGTYQYNLSYRQVKGLDQSLNSTYTDGVNIHNGKKADIWSYFVKSLTDGTNFTDSINGISITQISHDSGKAVIQIDLIPSLPPASPTSLSASAASSQSINLNWQDNANDEAGFKIERSLDGINGWSLVGQVGSNITSYQNSGLTQNTTYYYEVYAYKNSVNSDFSNTAQATTFAAQPPSAPSNLAATALAKRKMQLNWTDNANNETSLSLERSTNGTSWSVKAKLSANSTAYTDNGLTAGKTYYYRVRAENSDGNSAYSNTASAIAKR